MKYLFCTVLLVIISANAWASGWTPDDPLMPTGDSTQDTKNLQQRLHDSRLNVGSTLYLGEGTFRIHGVIGRQPLDPNAPSYSTVLFNGTIQGAPSSYAGVELWGSQGDLSFVIEKSKFHSENSWLWGPIFSEVDNQDGLIANNKFTGKGPAAMYLGVYDWSPGSVTIRGNNLDNSETTPDPLWLGTAPIWLGSFMVNSVVVGGDNEVNVFDEPAYDTSWNPLYDENGNPLTIPGYEDLIPPGEFGNLVPKNNTFTGVD